MAAKLISLGWLLTKVLTIPILALAALSFLLLLNKQQQLLEELE